MKKIVLVISLITLSIVTKAQLGVQLRLAGLGFDNLIKPVHTNLPSFQNKLKYTAELEKLIGSHLGIGVAYDKYIRDGDTEDYLYKEDQVKHRINLFKEKGYSVGYLTRFYFKEAINDVPDDGLYVEFSYKLAKFRQQFYTDDVWKESTYNVHRYGIKLGVTFTDRVTQEFYFAVSINKVGAENYLYQSPTAIRTFNVGIGYNWGFGF
jgi:hypothetical protein